MHAVGDLLEDIGIKRNSYHIEDGSGVLSLRFFHFYPSLPARLAEGARTRAFGEIRHGTSGPEMAHPKLLAAGAPIARALTPVYPTTAGLAQDTLRRTIVSRQIASRTQARQFRRLLYVVSLLLVAVLVNFGIRLRLRASALQRRAAFEARVREEGEPSAESSGDESPESGTE